MALSSNPKSSSSASKHPKPTYRRASGASAAKSSSARPAASRKSVARPSMGSRPKAAAKSAAVRPKTPVAKAGVAVPKPSVAKTKVATPKISTPKVVAPKIATPKVAAPKRAVAKPKVPFAKPQRAARTPKAASLKSSSLNAVPTQKKQRHMPAPFALIAAAFATVGAFFAGLFAKLPHPQLNRGRILAFACDAVTVLLAGIIVVYSGLFAATDIRVKGSTHVEQETAQALVKVPEGTTLFNVNQAPILESLKASPWVADVDIKREFPHTLIITPKEHTVKAIAYITADELAWGIAEDGTWIAPLSLIAAVDAEGNEVELAEDGSLPEGATQLSPFDAALRLANEAGGLLLTDVPSDANPKSGEPVTSKVVLAGLEYSKGFSAAFVAQIKSLSVGSVESVSAQLTSGIEVSLGAPEHITEKERVVTKLLEEQEGVTYINVREPGAYTFRGAPKQ